MALTVNAKLETKLNIVLVHLVLLVFQLPFKDVSGFLINVPAKLVPMVTNVCPVIACLVAVSMGTVPRENNVSMACV